MSDSAGARRGIRTPDRLIKRLQLAPGKRPRGAWVCIRIPAQEPLWAPSRPAPDILFNSSERSSGRERPTVTVRRRASETCRPINRVPARRWTGHEAIGTGMCTASMSVLVELGSTFAPLQRL